MYFHVIQPCITEPTRIVGRNKTSLIDNIFINTVNKNLNAINKDLPRKHYKLKK